VWTGDEPDAASIATRFLKVAGATTPPEQGRVELSWQLLLHNDNVNVAGYVIRTIMELTNLDEQEAKQRMERAHRIGIALLLRVPSEERAVSYRQQFANRGLTVTIEPVSVVQAELV
jgi:ATP-dependent Clp protease adapter protein ClpS